MRTQTPSLPSKKWSIVIWSLIAAASVVSSYVFLLVMAAACLGLPILLLRTGLHNPFTLILLTVFGLSMAGTILWSLIPRRDKFEEPGPLIDLDTQPRLRAEIAAIAAKLGEELPKEVYLVPDANAFVAERGGLLGVGNRRVMGLGLPLLEALNVSQFRAVLAHEFAHFYGGDTRLGPWVYNARSSMVRTFQNIDKASPFLSLVRRFWVVAVAHMVVVKILVTFWQLFLRLTQFISRKQEFRSDELACYAAGSEALAGGLMVVNRTAPAVVPFWNTVVLPIVQNGHQPKIAAGFAQFLVAPHIAEATAQHLEKEIAAPKKNPFDTHPPLAARLEKAKAFAVACGDLDERPATSLIDNLEVLELVLLHKLIPALASKELKPVGWETLGRDVYVPVWRQQVAPFQAQLALYTLAQAPAMLEKLRPKDPPGLLLTPEQRAGRSADIIEAAFTLSLLDHGWTLQARPGFVFLTHGDLRLEPGTAFLRLRRNEWTAEQWSKYCEQLGVASWPLAAVDAKQ